ncbi:hypothetical protein XEUV354_23960, partial [Xanthomonas euvesicatoria]
IWLSQLVTQPMLPRECQRYSSNNTIGIKVPIAAALSNVNHLLVSCVDLRFTMDERTAIYNIIDPRGMT